MIQTSSEHCIWRMSLQPLFKSIGLKSVFHNFCIFFNKKSVQEIHEHRKAQYKTVITYSLNNQKIITNSVLVHVLPCLRKHLWMGRHFASSLTPFAVSCGHRLQLWGSMNRPLWGHWDREAWTCWWVFCLFTVCLCDIPLLMSKLLSTHHITTRCCRSSSVATSHAIICMFTSKAL